jgi:hypothetical protein
MSRAESPLRGRLVFLVGARRSGTNWLHRMIGGHPEVLLVPSETHLISHGIEPLAERFHEGAASSTKTGRTYFPRRNFIEASRDLCDAVFLELQRALGPGTTLIVERTPLHANHLELIGELYPDAAVVHIVRDGRDVARSLRAQPWGPPTIAEAAHEWRETVERARAAAPSLRRYREVRYEALLEDATAEVAALHEWLGLPVESGVLAAVTSLSQVSYNADPGNPRLGSGKWRDELSGAELEELAAEAGELLEELGYRWEDLPRHRRIGRKKRPKGCAAAAPVEETVEQRADLVDAVLACLHERRFDRLDELLAADALIRVVDGGREVSGADRHARDALAETVGRVATQVQVRGDVHLGNPSTVVLAYDTGDGHLHERVVILSTRSGSVHRLTYYSLGAR